MKTQISIDRWTGKRLIRVLALLLPLAVVPMLRAQVPDPTGAWLLSYDFDFGFGKPFALAVFHQGGTFTGDLRGESAFDPHATINPTSGLQEEKTPPGLLNRWHRNCP